MSSQNSTVNHTSTKQILLLPLGNFNNRENSTLDNSIERCLPAQDNFIYLNEHSRLFLQLIFLVLLVVGVVANSVAVVLTYITKQWKNRSLRLIWFLCMHDTISSFASNLIYFFFLKSYREMSCTTKIALNMVAQFCTHQSAYLVCFIGIDRFIRIRYLNDYERVFTEQIFNISLAITFAVSIIQTVFTVIGPFYIGEGYGAIMNMPINAIIGSGTLACYFMSIHKLQQYTKQSRRISSSDRSLVKIASIHLFILCCCYSPVILYGMLYKPLKLDKATLAIFTALLFLMSTVHGLVNAIVFVTQNQQNRQNLKRLLRRNHQVHMVEFKRQTISSGNGAVIPSVHITKPDESQA